MPLKFPQFGCLAIFALVCLSGCDPVYYFMRVAPVQPPTSWSCISETIKGTPGITEVQPNTFKGLQDATIIHRYLYRVGTLENVLYFIQRHDGSVEYHHGINGFLEPRLSDSELDKHVALLHEVEQTLQEKCGLGQLNNVKQKCQWAECETAGIISD